MGEKPLETPNNGMVLDAQDPKLKEIDESTNKFWENQTNRDINQRNRERNIQYQ
jgi:hypothetical protein